MNLLRVSNQQAWYAFLITLWQTLVQSHFTENLAELVFCQIAVPKRLHQMNVFGWIVGMEHIQYGTKQIACIGTSKLLKYPSVETHRLQQTKFLKPIKTLNLSTVFLL